MLTTDLCPTATWFNVGLGSCGVFNVDSDFIVAVDIHTIQTFPGAGSNPNTYVLGTLVLVQPLMYAHDCAHRNPMCGRLMQVNTPDGHSVTVTVADTCPSCAVGSVDLTPAAFKKLAPLSVGRIHGVKWTLL